MTKKATVLCACLTTLVLGLSACGGDSTTETATAPVDADAPATGTLKVFAYEDSVTPEMMDPFLEQNPDLDVKTATFDSNSEAAAKLAGGFQADVVEVCLDESKSLTARNLLRPVDTDGVTEWNQMALNEDKGLAFEDGALMVPLSAGPLGLIYNTEEVPEGITSYSDLYDPQFAGRASLSGDYALPPIAVTALSLGIEDPMNMSEEELTRVADYMNENREQFRSLSQSDSDLVNLFKSGEVVVADANTAVAERMKEAGLPVEWVEPDEGSISWVCGFGISSKAENTDAAYRLINWQASPEAQAIRGENGYVVTNPRALDQIPERYKATSDPSALETAIPMTYPPIFDRWVRAFETFQAG
jgi:spermidine/putrescine transport system substrate-binding protein